MVFMSLRRQVKWKFKSFLHRKQRCILSDGRRTKKKGSDLVLMQKKKTRSKIAFPSRYEKTFHATFGLFRQVKIVEI
jgi:hypothetical protein